MLDPGCKARRCVLEKGITHCGYCADYLCPMFPAEPTREELLQKIVAEKQWTWEDGKLMTAYSCKKNMDEFCKMRKAQKIILLNGPSSAGKSSVAREMQKHFERAVIIALDDYLPMSNDEPIWEDDVFEVMPRMCDDLKRMAQKGCTVIIDHVITSERIHQALMESLNGMPLFSVMVTCDPAILPSCGNGNRPGATAALARRKHPCNICTLKPGTTFI